MKKTVMEQSLLYILASIFVIATAFPFMWVLVTSFKSLEQIYDPNQLIPTYITFDNYATVLFESNFIIYFFNSLYISTVVTFACMGLAIMAAYGFSRYKIFASTNIKLSILFTRMFPAILLAVPYYIIVSELGLIDSHSGLIIIYCSFVLPFSVWNMCSYFSQVPWELEEAAQIDGCNRISAFFKVILPVAKPGVFATSLYCFLKSWDEYMYAQTFINTSTKKTIQVGIRDYIGEFSTDWGALMASVVLSLVVVMVLFAFLQKNLVGGLAAGSVKG